jgi:hypothetical protein
MSDLARWRGSMKIETDEDRLLAEIERLRLDLVNAKAFARQVQGYLCAPPMSAGPEFLLDRSNEILNLPE